ncbi:NUDIX hydrolase [Rhizobium sp. LjRoot30]|uniref:NUDIX hydrolase n=1 Tax=Rhizobium sp. LjRoot30 TaxID=3342320 RepID=UPI003ECE2387
MILPWKADNRRTIHKDRWVDLTAERVVTGNGAILDPYYTLAYPDWAVAVALTPDDRLVMIRQYRHGTAMIDLELPGGCVDAEDVSAAEAARRELLEETGYGASEAEYLGRFAANPALQTNHVHVTLLRNAEKLAEPHLEPGEEIAVELMPLETVLQQVMAGSVTNSMHIAALFFALNALGRIRL